MKKTRTIPRDSKHYWSNEVYYVCVLWSILNQMLPKRDRAEFPVNPEWTEGLYVPQTIEYGEDVYLFEKVKTRLDQAEPRLDFGGARRYIFNAVRLEFATYCETRCPLVLIVSRNGNTPRLLRSFVKWRPATRRIKGTPWQGMNAYAARVPYALLSALDSLPEVAHWQVIDWGRDPVLSAKHNPVSIEEYSRFSKKAVIDRKRAVEALHKICDELCHSFPDEVELLELIVDEGLKPQLAARRLNITVSEYHNRKKRIFRRIRRYYPDLTGLLP